MITVKREGEKPPYESFYGKHPSYVHHLRRFGEVGVVTKFGGGEIKGKLADRGEIKVFVGYADDHPGDVYRMLNPSTGRISTTRDIMWLNTYKWGGHNDDENPPETWEIGENEDELKKKNSKNAKIEENVGENAPDNGEPTVHDDDDKIRSALRKLDTWYNPVLNEGGEFDTNESRTLRSGKIIGSLALCSLGMSADVVQVGKTGKS